MIKVGRLFTICLDPNDRDHLIFSGKVNGIDSRLSLLETADHGASLERIDPPQPFNDPSVEQIVPYGSSEFLVLISDGDGAGTGARRLFSIPALDALSGRDGGTR
jgi:hypothetical protein